MNIKVSTIISNKSDTFNQEFVIIPNKYLQSIISKPGQYTLSYDNYYIVGISSIEELISTSATFNGVWNYIHHYDYRIYISARLLDYKDAYTMDLKVARALKTLIDPHFYKCKIKTKNEILLNAG